LWVGAGGSGGSTWVVGAAGRDRDQLLEGRDASGEDAVRDALTVDVSAEACAQNGFVVELIGDAEAGLEQIFLNVDVAAWQIVKVVVVLARGCDGNVILCV
jgi:hypothetical protein